MTKATGPRSIFAKKLAQMKTAAEEVAYWAENMTANQRLQFQVCLSDAEIEATTWSIADTDRAVNQLKRDLWYSFKRPDTVHKGMCHLLHH
jgi:hypothetical protein